MAPFAVREARPIHTETTMQTATPQRGARIHVEFDTEATQALDRARRDVRLNRHNFIRSIVVRHLRETGALVSATEAGR